MKEGGPLRFYAGFPTFYARIAPHAMFTLIAQDLLKRYIGGAPAAKPKAAADIARTNSKMKPTITEVDRVFTSFKDVNGGGDTAKKE